MRMLSRLFLYLVLPEPELGWSVASPQSHERL